ncbi:MAG TPA: hypothetical protein VLT82_19295 [Myxococcaceae bacterium]|nr:hypothetical protein [Myxococcaceae bacterium]
MLTTLLLLVAAAPDAGTSEADDVAHAHGAAVDQRGDEGMGFSRRRTEHHFTLTGEGGVISADALDAADAATRDSIRSHFAHIARAFASGDFHLPMFIHDRMPPGAETMQRLRKDISYRAEPTERGARVVIRTANPEALQAVHAFLRFQISDHRTGDSPAVRN